MSDFLDLQGAKDLNTDAIHIGAVANSKDPVTGAAIDTHVNRAGGTDYTLQGFWNAIGPVVMPWTSVAGGTLTQPNQAFLHPTDGNYYSWCGAYPVGGYVVAPGTNPTAVTGYVPRTDVALRSELALSTGADLVGQGDTSRSVLDRLEDNASANDVSLLSDLDAKVKNKFIPAGAYTFNGQNITTIGDIDVSKRAVVSNSKYSGIIQQDADIAWLQQNHLEQEFRLTTRAAITSGNIPTAPRYSGFRQHDWKVMAYWYQDFGLEATRLASGAIGDLQWYYWSWLFHGSAGDGYQADRHPWLGYYRGDDPKVNDWICYWLCEAGVTAIIPQSRGDFSAIRANWANPADANYWMYKMFTESPNFKSLEYALWANSESNDTSPANRAAVESSFDEIVAIYNQYDNFAYVQNGRGVYPIVFCFDGEYWRGAYDSYNGDTNTKAMLVAQAAKFKAKGWSGFCVFGRNMYSTIVGDKDLEASGVLVLDATYESTNYNPALNGGVTPATTYSDLAVGVGTRPSTSTIPYKYTVPNVATALKSHSAHTSSFNYPGNTPDLFRTMVRNVVKRATVNGNPKILTIYNVSEWAEGGAALQPNMHDGKGYLHALKDALSSVSPDINEQRIYARQSPYFLSGPNVPIVPVDGNTTIPITVSYSWTFTATPVISDSLAYNGKRLVIMLDQSSIHSGPVTLPDESSLAGSKLKLSAATVALGKNDSITLEYDSLQDKWIQIANLVNVL